MRATPVLSLFFVAALPLFAARPAQAAPDDEDPKPALRRPGLTPDLPRLALAADAAPGSSAIASDDDDPKLGRAAAATSAAPSVAHKTPSLKLSYRYFKMPNLDRTSDLAFNAGQLDLYPISMRWFRIAIEGELGSASGSVGKSAISAWYLATGLSAGFQYPARVTPFVDARFIAGFIGGDVAGKTAVSYTWMAGIEGGAEFYLFNRFYLSAAIGWVHPLYHGVDLEFAMAHPTQDPMYQDISTDTFTLKVGIGL